MNTENSNPSTDVILLPTPTAWPIVLSVGIILLLAGLVTNWMISLLGAVLMVRSSVGWFTQVLPHESHEEVRVTTQTVEIKSTRAQVARLPIASTHRKILPIETFTITAGVKGGIAGGIAMLAPAGLFGLIRYHSLWYAPTLLAAVAIPDWASKSTAFLSSFHLEGLLLATLVHGLGSILVGLLYGAVLPMFPRKPILTAGFMAPLFWTGILYATLEALNPVLIHRIDWKWFIASQFAFGLVTGFVVNLHVRVRTEQFQSLPFSVRAGLESHEMEGNEEDRSQ